MRVIVATSLRACLEQEFDVIDTVSVASRQDQGKIVGSLYRFRSSDDLLTPYRDVLLLPFISVGVGRMLLCKLDYTDKPAPSIPIVDTLREKYDMWPLKKYGLPWVYWNVLLCRGTAPFMAKPEALS